MTYNYSNYSDNELLSLLDMFEKLTYNAKVELNEELVKRKTIEHGLKFKLLKESIKEKDLQINELLFLEKIGFIAVFLKNGAFQIIRSKKAKNMDLTGFFIGSILLLSASLGLLYSFLNFFELELFSRIIAIVLIIFFGRLGIILLYNSSNRMIKYRKFKLLIKNNRAILNKNVGNSIVTVENDVSDLKIESFDDSLLLKFGDVEIFNIKTPDLIIQKTLQALIAKTKENL